ncbi:hypothetical protein SO802_022638 [Lithocarpus litseifolius]|uniref:Large ribosomal subunit protein uL11 C-terminal domain-containing protein n=1 Tax=Lithocarpus litseifolius TaxID=425828 RepID=A0AAW2C792_9ROSI
MIPSTLALFSTCKLAFIAFHLFTALFIVTLSNGIITERSARVTERSARSFGESSDVVCDAQRHNRQAKVSVMPSVATLVIKALKEPERDRKKMKNIEHIRNISLDDIIETTKVTRPRSMAKDLSKTIKEILGAFCGLHGRWE